MRVSAAGGGGDGEANTKAIVKLQLHENDGASTCLESFAEMHLVRVVAVFEHDLIRLLRQELRLDHVLSRELSLLKPTTEQAHLSALTPCPQQCEFES